MEGERIFCMCAWMRRAAYNEKSVRYAARRIRTIRVIFSQLPQF